MPVNVERIVERADASLRRGEMQEVRRLREVANRAYRDLASEVRRRWPEAVDEAAGASRTFAEARARTLLGQLEPYTEALNWGSEGSGVPRVVRDMTILGADAGQEATRELLSAYGVELATATAAIDTRAVEAAVRNSQARLRNHSQQAIQRIEQAVVNGLVRGQGSQAVTRSVREAIKGDARTPNAGLYHRAETIARTELATAKHQASAERYAEAGVDQVQWYATVGDERTCRFCAARHGNAYPRGSLEVPAHPRCRCYLAPFRPEFVEEDLVDVGMWRGQQDEIDELVETQVYDVTSFEREQGKSYPRAIWTPRSGIRA